MEAIGAQPKMTKQSAARQQVLELIERLGVGTAIPSERQLSVDLGVSRLTVRAALDDLAREGYLVRRRGSGTYVQQPKITQQLTMTSFSEDMRRRGMVPGSRTLSLETELAGARLGRLLHVSPSEEILVIKRLRLADGETIDLGGKRVRHIDTPHVPHGWEARVLLEETTGTLLCGDLFTHVGDGKALVESDIVEPAMAAEELFQATCLTPATAPTIRRLADLAPRRLALMHGSTFAGDASAALRELAGYYGRKLESATRA